MWDNATIYLRIVNKIRSTTMWTGTNILIKKMLDTHKTNIYIRAWIQHFASSQLI